MKYELRDFQILEAIHQYGTFAKAAEQLHRTPFAITQSIHKLESLLGVALFDRSNYRPIFTREGLVFLERGRQILKQIEQLEGALNLMEKGWESEFSIAYDDLISSEALFPLIQEFQIIVPHVNINLHREVLNGCWDALYQGRSTLAIGASGEHPIGLSSNQKTIGEVDFVFAVAPHHPLAKLPDPLSKEDMINFHSVVIADTSSHLPARTSGILVGQPKLLVPNMNTKIEAQRAGLGIGYLPKHRIENLLKKGQLIEKRVVDQQKSKTYLKAAWLTEPSSQVLSWFLNKLDNPAVQKSLFKSD